jgi:hypothetical protein
MPLQVESKSQDFVSSYFLDRDFWRLVLSQNTDGVVVAVPERGVLFYTALSNANGVAALKRDIPGMYAAAGRLCVSSALHLFKDDRWTVLQPPQR